jgi:molybdenum cofactor cytidylyltransferase
VEIIILAGETAIMDSHDIAPRAVERSGGEVTCFGAPVDPGNLLMLAYLDGVPIVGAPGCVRSQKTNVIEWVLPPLLAGERLLEDIPKRPMPRE